MAYRRHNAPEDYTVTGLNHAQSLQRAQDFATAASAWGHLFFCSQSKDRVEAQSRLFTWLLVTMTN